jgi:hypothetical protein
MQQQRVELVASNREMIKIRAVIVCVNELVDTYNPAAINHRKKNRRHPAAIAAAKKKHRHPAAAAAGGGQWDLVNVA